MEQHLKFMKAPCVLTRTNCVPACFSPNGFQGPDPASARAHSYVWLCKRPHGNKVLPEIKSVAEFPTPLFSGGMQSIPQDMYHRIRSSGSRFRTKVCIQSRTFHCLEIEICLGASCRCITFFLCLPSRSAKGNAEIKQYETLG